MSTSAVSERPVALLRYLDVVLVVASAPILLLMGVSAPGYGIGAGAWIVLRGFGVAVERYASGVTDPSRAIGLRLGYMLARLFALALVVVLARRNEGRDAGLTALILIVVAFTVQLGVSAVTRSR